MRRLKYRLFASIFIYSVVAAVAWSWCVGDPNNINYMLAVKNVFLRGGGQQHPSWRGLSILSNKPASHCKMDTHSQIFSTSDHASVAQKLPQPPVQPWNFGLYVAKGPPGYLFTYFLGHFTQSANQQFMILHLVLGKYDLGARQQFLFEFSQAQFSRNLFFFFFMIPARPKGWVQQSTDTGPQHNWIRATIWAPTLTLLSGEDNSSLLF